MLPFVVLVLPVTAQAAVHASQAGGVLVLQGNDAHDHVVLEDRGGGVLVVESDGGALSGCTSADSYRVQCHGVTSVEFRGEGGDDRLYVRESNGLPVSAFGGEGADSLGGSLGTDVLRGGPGDDGLTPRPGGAPGDELDGGDGADVVNYNGYDPYTDPVTIRLPEPGGTTTGNGAAGEDQTLHDVEVAAGGMGADLLVGSSMADTLDGGDGPDQIQAGGGSDRVTARDGSVDAIDCGPGDDVVRADLPTDPLASCEGLEPQGVGPIQVDGAPFRGRTLTASGVTGLGSPGLTVTYAWHDCGRYSCSTAPFLTGPTFTVDEQHTGGYLRLFAPFATVTNAFGTDVVQGPTLAGIEPGPVLSAGGAGGSGDAPGKVSGEPDRRVLAERALRGKLVKVRQLSLGPVTAFRRAGALNLSRSRTGLPALVLVTGRQRASLTMRASVRLGRRGVRTLRLRTQRITLAPATARVYRLRLSTNHRKRLRRARSGRLVLRIQVGSGASASTGQVTLPVR